MDLGVIKSVTKNVVGQIDKMLLELQQQIRDGEKEKAMATVEKMQKTVATVKIWLPD